MTDSLDWYVAGLDAVEARLRADLERMRAWPEPPHGTVEVPSAGDGPGVAAVAEESGKAGDVVRVRFV